MVEIYQTNDNQQNGHKVFSDQIIPQFILYQSMERIQKLFPVQVNEQ